MCESVWCMCVCVCVGGCMNKPQWRSEDSFKGQFPLSAFLRQGSLCFHCDSLSRPAGPWALGGSPVFTFCLTLGVLGLQMHATSPASFCGCCQAPVEMLCLLRHLARPYFYFYFWLGRKCRFRERMEVFIGFSFSARLGVTQRSIKIK